MLIPTIITGVIAIVARYWLSTGCWGTYFGIKISREHTTSDFPVADFRIHYSWYDSSSCPYRDNIQVGRHRIRPQRHINWHGAWWSHTRRTLCEYAHRSWSPTLRGGYWHYGSLFNRLVTVGSFTNATRNRYNGLEIHANPSGMYLFLPANSWTNS